MVPEELEDLSLPLPFNARDQVNCKNIPLPVGPWLSSPFGCAYTLPVILMTGSGYPSYFPFETQRIGWLLSRSKWKWTLTLNTTFQSACPLWKDNRVTSLLLRRVKKGATFCEKAQSECQSPSSSNHLWTWFFLVFTFCGVFLYVSRLVHGPATLPRFLFCLTLLVVFSRFIWSYVDRTLLCLHGHSNNHPPSGAIKLEHWDPCVKGAVLDFWPLCFCHNAHVDISVELFVDFESTQFWLLHDPYAWTANKIPSSGNLSNILQPKRADWNKACQPTFCFRENSNFASLKNSKIWIWIVSFAGVYKVSMTYLIWSQKGLLGKSNHVNVLWGGPAIAGPQIDSASSEALMYVTPVLGVILRWYGGPHLG